MKSNPAREMHEVIGVRTCSFSPNGVSGLTVAALYWNLTSFPNSLLYFLKGTSLVYTYLIYYVKEKCGYKEKNPSKAGKNNGIWNL
jgi:hypothetical protein